MTHASLHQAIDGKRYGIALVHRQHENNMPMSLKRNSFHAALVFACSIQAILWCQWHAVLRHDEQFQYRASCQESPARAIERPRQRVRNDKKQSDALYALRTQNTTFVNELA